MSLCRMTAAWILVIALAAAAGCTAGASREGDTMRKLTWKLAKTATQARELEVAAAIPAEWASEVTQSPDGMLLSCGDGEYTWNGATSVTLVAGADPESAVQAVEAHYQGQPFEVRTRKNIVNKYEVQLIAADSGENYIIAEGQPGTIRIASGSPCFALPEGTYPGGAW